LQGTSTPFSYNQTEEFLTKVNNLDGEVAAVVIESVRNFAPVEGFFDTIQRVCKEKGIVLILDEITAGFRMNHGGAHLRYGIEPDMAVFGKAFSNGYPMGAIIGKKEIMEAAQTSFISSLFWTERVGLAATIATMKKMKAANSAQRVVAIGEQVQAGWKKISEETGVEINISGMPAISAFGFKHDTPLVLKTYLTQEMLKRGYLATTAFYASCAHEGYVEGYLAALKEVFESIKSMLDSGDDPMSYLEGPVCHSGFKRLT
jgi:glutamate-1-semialdehyde 2,1-aminomutase